MKDANFRQWGLAAVLVVSVLAFGVVEGTGLLVPPTSAESPPRPDVPDSATAVTPPRTTPATVSTVPAGNATVTMANSAPATQGSPDFPIHDSDLKTLGAMVDLGNAAKETPNKEHWTRAIAVAQTLLNGPCDCEQRNWLTHFVDTGNAALADSPDYYKLAQVLPTLALNDQRNSYY